MSVDKEPEKRAAALALEDDHARLVARGNDQVAEDIIRVARENDIPVFEDLALSYRFEELPLGAQIPEKVFFALTQTMEYIYAFGKEADESNE